MRRSYDSRCQSIFSGAGVHGIVTKGAGLDRYRQVYRHCLRQPHSVRRTRDPSLDGSRGSSGFGSDGFFRQCADGNPAFDNTLMPQPAHLTANTGSLALTPQFTAAPDKFHDARLETRSPACSPALSRGPACRSLPSPSLRRPPYRFRRWPGQAIQGLDEDESYTLDVTAQGAHLHAATDVGGIHGLETLLQLVQSDGTDTGCLSFPFRIPHASAGAGS